MISTSTGFRASFRCLIAAALLVPGLARAASSRSGQSGIAALAAATPMVGGSGIPAPAATPSARRAECAVGVADSCYEAGASRYINVGSFFDRLQTPRLTHYIVKYFEPGAVRTRLVSFSFISNRAVTYAAAGAVVTRRDAPVLPATSDLRALRHLLIPAAAGEPTCVDLAGDNLVLESDQAAWLILQFSDPLDTDFTGVKADSDANDHPFCDYMTRDAGELWYRPDPSQTKLDWEFTPFSSVLPSKQQMRWSQIKTLYR